MLGSLKKAQRDKARQFMVFTGVGCVHLPPCLSVRRSVRFSSLLREPGAD